MTPRSGQTREKQVVLLEEKLMYLTYWPRAVDLERE